MIIGIIVGIVALILLVTAGLSVKIVREYQRVVLFRLGRALGTRGPGLVFINPATDRTTWVDLRERFLEIPRQTAITQDNASISIDFIIFYKVIDPSMSVLEVQNFAAAAQNVAATTLRSVVGDMALDDVLSKREEINASLRVRLDEVTERWGVKVTTVEVREVNPPPGVLEAMTRQMSAERTRRAAIIEAQGQKSAAITIAEGAQQSVVLAAEGERQSAILRAEGLSTALEKIRTVGRQLDANTMRLQYYETLKQVGASPSTKLVLPMEIGGLINSLRGMMSGDSGVNQAAEASGPPGSTASAEPGGAAALAEPASNHQPIAPSGPTDALGPGTAEANGSQLPTAGGLAAEAAGSGTAVEANGSQVPVAGAVPDEIPRTAPIAETGSDHPPAG